MRAVVVVNPGSAIIPFDTAAHEAKVDSADSVLSLAQRLAVYGRGGNLAATAVCRSGACPEWSVPKGPIPKPHQVRFAEMFVAHRLNPPCKPLRRIGIGQEVRTLATSGTTSSRGPAPIGN
jgi:hypothetical protein